MITEDLLASYQQYTIEAAAKQNGYKIKLYYPFLILPVSLFLIFVINLVLIIKSLPPSHISTASIALSILLILFLALTMLITAQKIRIFSFKYLAKNGKEIYFAEDRKNFIQETLLQKGCIAINKNNNYFFSSIIKSLEMIDKILSKELNSNFLSLIFIYISILNILPGIFPDKAIIIYIINITLVIMAAIISVFFYVTTWKKRKKRQNYYELYLILLELQLRDSMKKV